MQNACWISALWQKGVASTGVISRRDEVGQRRRLHLIRFFIVHSSQPESRRKLLIATTAEDR